jgi:Tfp pilus assembly protein PilO
VSRRAPLVAAVVFVLLAVVAVFLLVLPKMSDVEEAEQQLQTARDQEVVLQAQLSQLQAAAENAEDLRRELARFRRSVPPVADLPGLINDLQTAADVAAVDFFSVAPGDPAAAPTGGAAEIPATIQVIGNFFPVDEFLFRLETLRRAAKVVAVTVGAGPDGLPQISVGLDTRFYTTDLDAGPGAAPPAPGGAPAPGTEASPSPGATPSPAAPAVPTETPGA